MKKLLAIGLLGLSLGGCVSITSWLQNVDNTVNTYAPIVGKDILLVGDILITAECSPVTSVSTQVAENILNIVAPNSAAASTVQNFFVLNTAVASQLCPFVQAIKASVGSVPSGTPTQTIVVPPAQKAALHWRRK